MYDCLNKRKTKESFLPAKCCHSCVAIALYMLYCTRYALATPRSLYK